MLWSRNATANVATSITAGDCVRSGRKTSRSIATESASTTREAEEDPEPSAGQSHCDAKRERVRAGHDQLAVGEVDEAQHAEDEADADRHQRVDRAERERVGERLPVDVEDGERHEKYAATSRSVSPASSGPSVSRSSPFAIT